MNNFDLSFYKGKKVLVTGHTGFKGTWLVSLLLSAGAPVSYTHLAEKEKGKSVLLVSTELSEIFALSDRIAVMYKGKIMGIYKNGELTTEKIGLLMAGYQPDKEGEA